MQSEQEIYIKYMEALKQKLIAKYDELGLRASGEFENQLEYTVSKNKMSMSGAYHTWFMENGRGAGFVPVQVIKDWIDTKQGLPSEFKEKKESIAYAIATKIAKEGIKVPNEHNPGKLISDIVDEFLAKDIYDMIEELGQVYLGRIQSDVLRMFQQIAA